MQTACSPHQPRLLLLSVVSFVLLAGGVLAGTKVYAQETTTTPSVEVAASPTPTLPPGKVSQDTIFIKPQDTARQTELLKLYQDQVEKYRKLERQYRISKAQFEKLNTLQSLEEAVVATREVMSSRADVLITYSELVHTHLEETEGIDVSAKSSTLKKLEEQVIVLREHKKKIDETKDRAGIAERVTEFDTATANLEFNVYTALSLISTGRVQTVFDKAVILYADIKKHHTENPVSELRQQERERAYTEVNNTINNLEMDMLRIQTTLREEGGSKNSYTQKLNQNLNAAYSNNSQLLDFLDELFFKLT